MILTSPSSLHSAQAKRVTSFSPSNTATISTSSTHTGTISTRSGTRPDKKRVEVAIGLVNSLRYEIDRLDPGGDLIQGPRGPRSDWYRLREVDLDQIQPLDQRV